MRQVVRRFALEAPARAVWRVAAEPLAWPQVLSQIRTVSVPQEQTGPDGWRSQAVAVAIVYRELVQWDGMLALRSHPGRLEITLAPGDNPFVEAQVHIRFEPSGTGGPDAALIDGAYRARNLLLDLLLRRKLEGVLVRIVRAFDALAARSGPQV